MNTVKGCVHKDSKLFQALAEVQMHARELWLTCSALLNWLCCQ